MTDRTEEAQERFNDITALKTAMQSTWPSICVELERIRQRQIESLISSENEQTRGRVLQLEDLKRLPETLLQEQTALKDALPE